MDRVSGGATILLHINGNQIPGMPHVPEAVNAQVYITPYIKTSIPGADVTVARMVQMFIEDIGLPSIARWERAMAKNGKSSNESATEFSVRDERMRVETGIYCRTDCT